MAIHIGYRKAGFPGLILAGICFILPAAAIVTAIAWAYVHYGSLPQLGIVLRTVKPIIIVVVLQAMWSLRENCTQESVDGRDCDRQRDAECGRSP